MVERAKPELQGEKSSKPYDVCSTFWERILVGLEQLDPSSAASGYLQATENDITQTKHISMELLKQILCIAY